MRISDWSSDVCSSDLLDPAEADQDIARMRRLDLEELALVEHLAHGFVHIIGLVGRGRDQCIEAGLNPVPRIGGRSEEHTSALQSLMRSSYALFGWKTQKKRIKNAITHRQH